MSELLEITDDSFEQEVNQSDRLVIVDFWATWCGPCKLITPVLEEISSEMGERVKIVTLNVESNSRTPTACGVLGLPTLLFFYNGKVIDSITGVVSKANLVSRIERIHAG